MTAMDSISLDRAHADFRRRLESVSADHWNLPTPCKRWAVVDLVRHMAVGATMSRQILAGERSTREAVVEEVSTAPDLKAEWEWRTAEERSGFAAPGASDRKVAHPVMGDIPCAEFLGMRVGDALLHTWDLARALVLMTNSTLTSSPRFGPPCLRLPVSLARVASSVRDRAAKLARTHRCRLDCSTYPAVAHSISAERPRKSADL